ncbi:phosphate acyltransferase PlsX [Wenzhouxiangella sp. AB-CW3]|uniref:phosphate acyltransferase PlsX n=1 Tax=Wenzhouxiangella sp. AB-CW3 TaxID=2771012 RepID=UPI00168B1F29|nr:phosphate acyltransferase PlsX [Wenzhouxiangella sp. AB-CW3]QOC23998.1 phosphate acyltransferase PlsX [Wenzhouxiangella sp. AB-CW3]
MSENRETCIAVDAMSGDGACRVTVPGALRALRADPRLRLVLVGEPDAITNTLGAAGRDLRDRIEVEPATSTLPMEVGAARALRSGRGSSMQHALELAVSGRARAVVSGGNTGALMALSRQAMGMLPGIERPALMAAIPGVGESVWMLDLGANVGVDAQRLLEFARLGGIAVRVLSGREPRVGLLNIGHEPSKGPDVLREAARLMEAEHDVNYCGFVEADGVFSGVVDLLVCDGFAGNVLLKSAEGMARLMFARMRQSLGRGPAGWLAARHLKALHDRLDPAVHNGAPLLGVQGTVIKSHGSACERGFEAAIALAALEARRDLVSRLEQQLWASY